MLFNISWTFTGGGQNLLHSASKEKTSGVLPGLFSKHSIADLETASVTLVCEDNSFEADNKDICVEMNSDISSLCT